MNWTTRRWTLARLLALLLTMMLITPSRVALAQVTTTQVADTIYRADGTAAAGIVVVSWPAFSTATGQAVPPGSVSVPIGAGGAISVQLAPNAGSNPMGSYYTAQYHLNDGSNSKEYWVVPASGTPVKIGAIKSTVMPLSVAQNSVSKSYVDQAIANALTGGTAPGPVPGDGSAYVVKTGDTMTGPLVLPGNPTAATQAADKNYVDQTVQAVASGVGQKVSLVPQGTQTVVQPSGSQLQTNLLNGVVYASQYLNQLGNNGIATAAATADCAHGCELRADNSYPSTERGQPGGWKNQTHLNDSRLGGHRDTFLNPGDIGGQGNAVGQSIALLSTTNTALSNGSLVTQTPNSVALDVSIQALAGGNNLFPADLETVPYGKTNYHAQQMSGNFYTAGQHQLLAQSINCYGVGDCLIGSQYMFASGGFRDEADEGAHPYDLITAEDGNVFAGTCTSGCGTGATTVTITPTAAGGTQGEGRFLIDMNPAKVISTGSLVGGNVYGNPYATAQFSGSNFPVSTFFVTTQTDTSQANNIAPGVVTLPIKSSAVPAGFSTNTAAAPATSGVACVADLSPGSTFLLPYYEMAPYTVVDGTHFRLTLNKPHNAAATIAIGGLCGYGLEQKVDTVLGIRQLFPVVGSYSTTGLYYASGTTPIVGIMDRTSAYLNFSAPISAVSRTGNVVTLSGAGNFPRDVNGLSMTISGVTDSSYNGTFPVTTVGAGTLTYTQTGQPDSTSSGGTLSYLTGGFALYPMAEVLTVMNPATVTVDGKMTLAPNTVTWAVNDPVEQPHYYQERVALDSHEVAQITPRPSTAQSAGISYTGNTGPGLTGYFISNNVPASNYLGAGGTHSLPSTAMAVNGVWQETLGLQAGANSAIHISCNYHGCGRWNSFYNLFVLDSNAGADLIRYDPSTSILQYELGTGQYTFSPQALTATNIVANTVTATTFNGKVSGNSITSGAVAAAYLPLLGGSGSSHAAGIVPDPGPNSGATRFLREDGTWSLPAGAAAPGSVAGLVPGASADFNFLQGSGTVVTDSSGNANNGTFSATAPPTWTATGLAFQNGQGVTLPAALNGTQTFFLGVYINPLTAGPQYGAGQYPVLVSSSTGGSGFNFMYDYSPAPNGFLPEAYAPSLYVNGQTATTTPNLLAGFHVLAATLGTPGSTPDHVYIDGTEVAAYTQQGSSANQQTSGSFVLGSSGVNPWTNSGIYGTMYRMRTYPTALTATAVQAVSSAIANEVASRGVAIAPVAIPLAAPQFQAVGDSITYGQNISNAWPSLMTLTGQPAYTVTNWGITGIALAALNGSEPNRAALRCRTSAGPSIAVVFAGTNDFTLLATSAAGVFTNLMGEIQTLKQAGCKVFAGTMISRIGNDAVGGTLDADKNAYDAIILSQARAGGADGIIDFAANPLMGADGAYAGPMFQVDHIHPTQAGQALLAAAASNVLNYTFGYNETNPHVVPAPNYAMTAADGYVSLSGLTGASTLTLPDCTGQSGAIYRINNPQAAFAAAVQPFAAGQQINGLASVPVPANATLTLRDTPNPKTTAGCHWDM